MEYCLKSWNEEEYTNFINSLIDISKKVDKKQLYEKSYNDEKKEVLGIKIPLLRDISKQILKGNSNQFIKISKNHNKYVEEVIIQGFVIAYSNEDIQIKLKNIDEFIPKITNWAICDTFIPSLKSAVLKNKSKYLEYISKYFASKSEFERRFYVVSLLYYYIEYDTIDYVLERLNEISLDGYYVKMAVAWTICDAYIYDKDKTLNFLNSNRLDKFTQNKAISKISDSFRVTKQEKEIVKKYRKI